MSTNVGRVRPQSLPRLADQAVRRTLAPPRATLLMCGLVLALVNGGLTALLALVGDNLETTAGSMIALGSMMLWLPVTIVLTTLVILILAVYATHREIVGVELGFLEAIGYLFRPRVAATLVLVLVPILVASLFLVIPGLVLAVLLSLVIPVMVSERLFLMEAVLRSFHLVWSNPEGRLLKSPMVRVVALVAVFVVLGTLMTLVLQVPMQLLTQGVVFREVLSGAEPSAASFSMINWISLPFSVVSAVISVGVYSYFFHAIALYYRDLVERREARDLRMKIQQVQAFTSSPEALE